MLSMKGRTTSEARGVNFFQNREEGLKFAICQFSKKQVLVSSETAAATRRREAVGAGSALGEDRRGRGQEVCSTGNLKALTNKQTNKQIKQQNKKQQIQRTSMHDGERITSL